jgi:hypothetical protein
MPSASFCDYGRIMLSLPATIGEAAEAAGMAHHGTSLILRQLWTLGLVRPVSSELRTKSGTTHRVTIWSADDLPEVEHIGKKVRAKPSLIAFASLWRAMEGGGTIKDIVEETGLHTRSIERFITTLREHIHVRAWERSPHKNWAGVYRLGRRPDAPKPPLKTNAQVKFDMRQREKLRRIHMLGANLPTRREAIAA